MNLKPIFGALFVAAFMLSLAAIPASAGSVGYKIGVQSGTTSDTYAAESLPNAVVQGFDTIDGALLALKQGDVQFVMGDLPTLKFYEAEADSGVSVVGSFGAEDFGIGVPLGESELLDAINMALGEVISSGDYDAIFAVSFGNEIVVLTDDTDASTATAYPSPTAGGKLDGILQDNGTIVFGSDTTYPPFESLDADGNCVGFDCDIADAIAGKLAAHYGLDNFSATMKTKDWNELTAFIYDDYDATLSAMTKTVQRAEQTQFTRAYYSSKQGILGTSDSPAITGVDDLNTLVEHEHEDGGLPGLSLLVSAGALGAIALRRRH